MRLITVAAATQQSDTRSQPQQIVADFLPYLCLCLVDEPGFVTTPFFEKFCFFLLSFQSFYKINLFWCSQRFLSLGCLLSSKNAKRCVDFVTQCEHSCSFTEAQELCHCVAAKAQHDCSGTHLSLASCGSVISATSPQAQE